MERLRKRFTAKRHPNRSHSRKSFDPLELAHLEAQVGIRDVGGSILKSVNVAHRPVLAILAIRQTNIYLHRKSFHIATNLVATTLEAVFRGFRRQHSLAKSKAFRRVRLPCS